VRGTERLRRVVLLLVSQVVGVERLARDALADTGSPTIAID
jgi:hypothetical protein